MDNIKNIHHVDDFEHAKMNHSIIVFSTQWCPDCHFLKTFLDDLIKENKQWMFYYVDRDELTDLCIDLEILGIPSFIAYNQGKEIGRFVSKLRKTKEEIQNFIDSLG